MLVILFFCQPYIFIHPDASTLRRLIAVAYVFFRHDAYMYSCSRHHFFIYYQMHLACLIYHMLVVIY